MRRNHQVFQRRNLDIMHHNANLLNKMNAHLNQQIFETYSDSDVNYDDFLNTKDIDSSDENGYFACCLTSSIIISTHSSSSVKRKRER